LEAEVLVLDSHSRVPPLDSSFVQIDVVSGIMGIDSSAYSVGYIAGWSNGDTELVKSTAARVLRVSHQIA
jgi:hypothetical protein